MPRNLNVRVWDKEKKRMASIQWHISYVFFEDENDPYGADKIPLQFVMSVTNSDRFKKLLSTTEYDRTGKEIFEGDVVRRDYKRCQFIESKNDWVDNIKKDAIGFFKWGSHGFYIEQLSGDCFAFNTPDGDNWYADELTVIGNIYENPEFLDEDDEDE